MRVFVTGDTHIPIDIKKLGSGLFPQGKELSKDDVVIIVGDFGLLWGPTMDKEEEYWLNWLSDKPWTTLFCDGNHENHFRLSQLPSKEMFGADVGVVSDSIFHLRRGRVYRIDNFKTFVMGGAESHDKEHRVENISWWKEEIPSYSEFDQGLQNLEDNDNEVDLILTHTAPKRIVDSVFSFTKKGNDPTCKFFDTLLDRVQFGHWFCGHFHVDKTVFDQFTFLYNRVIEIS